MTTATATADLLESVERIRPIIEQHADRAEAERKLPDALYAALKESGLFAMLQPRAYGGMELRPAEAMRVWEAVARIDPATVPEARRRQVVTLPDGGTLDLAAGFVKRTVAGRALLMTRSEVGSGVSRPLPSTMLAVDYAPHEVIFPRAALVVHHGGVGTLGQALRSGRPMLVVPHAHDQYDNAERMRRAGVSRTIDTKGYRSRVVARCLDTLLGDASYRDRAAWAASVVRAERGAEAAVDVIEAVLAGGDDPEP